MIPVAFQTVLVQPFTQAGRLPCAMRAREESDAWYVRCLPFGEEGVEWEWCLEGKLLRVPVFPYLTKSVEPEKAMAFAVQLGMTAMCEVAGGDEIVQAHLAVGYPIEDLGDRLRYWLGVAFQLRRKP